MTRCLRSDHHHHHHDIPTERNENPTEALGTSSFEREPTTRNESKQPENKGEGVDHESSDDVAVSPCHCCSDDPVHDLETLQNMALEIEKNDEDNGVWEGPKPHDQHSSDGEQESESDEENRASDNLSQAQEKRIMAMSINTAIAIGLHNFPEGLATFVAALNDPKVGTVLAVAIAIHNIPEGLCVALPIYYATGNRWKAFGWACISGASGTYVLK